MKNAKSVLCVLIIITAALGRKRCCQSWSSSCSSSGRHGCHSLDADPQTTKAGHWCGVTKSLYKSRHGRDTGSLRTTTTSCWTCCLGRRRRIIWPRTAASSCRTSDDLSQPHDGLNAWTELRRRAPEKSEDKTKRYRCSSASSPGWNVYSKILKPKSAWLTTDWRHLFTYEIIEETVY